MYLCWSAKGGSGTTVIAAALGLVLSHHRPTLLVDLGGDAPAALGMAEPSGPGVHDWLVVTAFLPRTYGYLMPYASIAILAVFGVILAKRFSGALAGLEQMNIELEATAKAYPSGSSHL